MSKPIYMCVCARARFWIIAVKLMLLVVDMSDIFEEVNWAGL